MLIDEATERSLRTMGEALLDQLEDLVELANERIACELASYPRLVPAADLAESGRNVIGMVLGSLTGRPTDPRAISEAVSRGRRRQAQGIALEDVLRAVRMDFTVLWSRVLEHAARTPDPAAVSMLAMLRIWESLDETMVALAEGYRYEETLFDREVQARRNRVFASLAYAPDPDPGLLSRAAEILGFRPDARLLIAAGRFTEGSDYRLEMRWRSLGAPAYVGPLGNDVLGVTTWSQHARRVLDEMIGAQPESAAVVAPPAQGLRRLHDGIAIARAALRGAPAGTVVDSRDLLVEALVAESAVVATTLPAAVLADLLALPTAERGRLMETVDGWLTTDGTTADIARRLRRHRNTVINHLRRVEELTQLSLACPADIATLVAALKALRPAR